MADDFLKELGYLSLASRLKRISDKMMHNGREMYRKLGIDVEPNWYLVILLLKEHNELSITEISSRLGIAHTSVMTMVNRMVTNGYVHTFKSDKDARKQMLGLTDKAIAMLPELEHIWTSGTAGIAEIFDHSDQLLNMLEQLENGLNDSNFMDRTIIKMAQNDND